MCLSPPLVLQIKLEAVLQQTKRTSDGAAISQQAMKTCFLILQRNKAALLCLFHYLFITILYVPWQKEHVFPQFKKPDRENVCRLKYI